MIKTFYPHWGEHTAFNAFIPHFDPSRFSITMVNVPMGRSPLLQRMLRALLAATGRNAEQCAYGPRDLLAEVAAAFKTVSKKIDIIHLLDAEHGLMYLPDLLGMLRTLSAAPRIIALFHQPPSLLAGMVNPRIVRNVDCIQVVAPAQADFFRALVPEVKIETTLLGVDTEYFAPPLSRPLSEKFRCLSGGVWLRDFDAVYRTAELLKEQPQIEFHIVAPRDESRAELQNIFYHEGIPDEELLHLYQGCDLLFLPLKDATANTFLLEGCACGLPIISTDLPSLKVYFPGEEAVLIQHNRAEEFAAVIGVLCNSPHRLRLMSEKARRRAEELSWKNITGLYQDIYQRLSGYRPCGTERRGSGEPGSWQTTLRHG
jgi:glycosyltransferase involved in cell wall biosynthesis